MKLFFKITIIVFCFLFFGCKKQFDKDYYKDCVGEDSVEPYYYTLITPMQMDFFLSQEVNYNKYIRKQSVVAPQYALFLDDTLVSDFKTEIKNKLPHKISEQWMIDLLNVDTAKQSIVISMYYYYYQLGKNKKAYCSNHYQFINSNNELQLQHSLRAPKNSRLEDELDFTRTIIIVDKFNINVKYIQKNDTKICN